MVVDYKALNKNLNHQNSQEAFCFLSLPQGWAVTLLLGPLLLCASLVLPEVTNYAFRNPVNIIVSNSDNVPWAFHLLDFVLYFPSQP